MLGSMDGGNLGRSVLFYEYRVSRVVYDMGRFTTLSLLRGIFGIFSESLS